MTSGPWAAIAHSSARSSRRFATGLASDHVGRDTESKPSLDFAVVGIGIGIGAGYERFMIHGGGRKRCRQYFGRFPQVSCAVLRIV